MQWKRVVIGVDFSKASAAATEWTARYFAPGAAIILVHVESPAGSSALDVSEPGPDDAGHRCAELSDLVGEGRAAVEVAHGEPASELARIATERDADLIVVGKHGAGVHHKQLGGTAERLILHSSLPLLLATGMSKRPPRSIVASLHDDASRARVVEWARSLSGDFDAACVALSVADGALRTHLLAMASLAARGCGLASHELDGNGDDAAPWMAELTEPSFPAAGGQLDAAETAYQVISAAERLHADLIVVGSSGLAAAAAEPGMSVACRITSHASCPVLVVKATAGRPTAGLRESVA